MTVEDVEHEVTSELIRIGFRVTSSREKFWGTTRDGGRTWEVRSDRAENRSGEGSAKLAIEEWAAAHADKMSALREDQEDHQEHQGAYA